MIAYNKAWINNLSVRQQAEAAMLEGCIEQQELAEITSRYPVKFYSPNIFIRIGLFVLTVIILLFSFGIFSLVSLDSIERLLGGLLIFFALLSYGALEFMVQSKNHFRSGVDDALLWTSAGCLLGGISYLANTGLLVESILIFMISLYSCLRFADGLMSVLLPLSVLGICFFTLNNLGPAAQAIIPFILMAISYFIYRMAKKLMPQQDNHLYADCLQMISVVALITLYFCGNYYVVREVSTSFLNLRIAPNGSFPFGILFWIFTAVIPCIYIARGIQKKDIVLLRVGLLLVAAIVFTVRYYYSVAPVEVVMTLGGIALVIISYVLIKYLKTPKYGFTSLETEKVNKKEKLALETILAVQTLNGQAATDKGTNFGGGSFGGGGSSGDF